MAVQHAEPPRWRRDASCGRRAREISARAAARRGSPELCFNLKAGGSGPRAPGPAARGIWAVPAANAARPAASGPSPGGLAWSLRRGPGAAGCPGGRCAGFSAMAAPRGLPLKSRDRRGGACQWAPASSCSCTQGTKLPSGLCLGYSQSPAPLMPEAAHLASRSGPSRVMAVQCYGGPGEGLRRQWVRRI